MNVLPSALGYTLICINGIVLLLISLIANRVLNKNTNDYFAAGHKVRWPLLSSSIVVVFAYASTLLVAAEGAYLHGWPAIWMYIASGVSLILMIPFFKRIKKILPNGTTIPEFLLSRFGKPVHLMSTVITIYLMIMVLLYTFTGLGFGLSPLFGISYESCIILAGVFIIFYSLFGGLWGSLITDYFQYFVIWIIVTVAAVIVILKVGGFGEIYEGLITVNETKGFSVYTNSALANYGSFMLIGWMTYALIDQTILQRVYAIDNQKNLSKMLTFGYIGWAFLPMVAGLFGIVALSQNINIGNSTSEVFPRVIGEYAPAWVAIAFAVLIFNAIASTINSVLVGLSNVITNDVYIRYFRNNKKISPKAHLVTAKALVVVFGIIGILISLKPNSILSLGMYMTNFIIVGSAPIITAFLMKKVSSQAVFWAKLIGFVTALFISGIDHVGETTIYTWQINAVLYILTMSIVIVGTAFTPKVKRVTVNPKTPDEPTFSNQLKSNPSIEG